MLLHEVSEILTLRTLTSMTAYRCVSNENRQTKLTWQVREKLDPKSDRVIDHRE
jgi:hypothetical protein